MTIEPPTRMADDFSGPGRLFCVRVNIPSLPGAARMHMVIAIRVTDDDVDRALPLAVRDGLDREDTFIACAIDGVRLMLARTGVDPGMLSQMTGSAKEVTQAEMIAVAERIRSKSA